MSFNPNLPAQNSLISSTELRAQFNGLKELIDAGVLSGVVIDEVLTLPPGTPATATAGMTGTVLHLSFGLPAGHDGNDGGEGPAGNDGNPGEVTTAALNEAIAGTARNPATVAPLGLTVSDPPTQADVQAVADKIDELIAALFRPPV